MRIFAVRKLSIEEPLKYSITGLSISNICPVKKWKRNIELPLYLSFQINGGCFAEKYKMWLRLFLIYELMMNLFYHAVQVE